MLLEIKLILGKKCLIYCSLFRFGESLDSYKVFIFFAKNLTYSYCQFIFWPEETTIMKFQTKRVYFFAFGHFLFT